MSRIRPGRPAKTARGRLVTQWATVSAGLAPVLLLGGWVAAGAFQPVSYSPIRQTLSVLASDARTDRWIMTAALFLVGGIETSRSRPLMLSTRRTIWAVTTSRSSAGSGPLMGAGQGIGARMITGDRRGHIRDQRMRAAVDDRHQLLADLPGIRHRCAREAL
jgi:hypothetical protein